MNESSAMLEIRQIKYRNSLRYCQMAPDELTKMFDETIKRFIKQMGKDIKTVKMPAASTTEI